MTVRKLVPLWSLALLVGSGTARPASAEWFVDLYGGGAFTQDVDVTIRNDVTLDDTIKLDDELTGGGRLGFYLRGFPWLGFALDVSYFAPAGQGSASEILPADLVVGPHHRVGEDVVNDGYLNHYRLGSPYGDFTAVSTAALRTRLPSGGVQ